VPLQVTFLELSGAEKKALHKSKAKDITLYHYGTSLQQPSLWRHLPVQQQELRAAIAAMGPGIVFIFLNLILLQPLQTFFSPIGRLLQH
jgi:hypothetical protein